MSKPLSAMLGHVSAATTLDIYTHITEDMQAEAAAKIDRGLGYEVQEKVSQPKPPQMTDFQPVGGQIRRSGTRGASPRLMTTSSRDATPRCGRMGKRH